MEKTLPSGIGRAVEALKAALSARFGPRLRQMTLFGSLARGNATEESDVDLLVLIEGLVHREKVEVLDLAADISFDHRVDLSPLVLSVADFEFLEARETRLALDIVREGVPL